MSDKPRNAPALLGGKVKARAVSFTISDLVGNAKYQDAEIKVQIVPGETATVLAPAGIWERTGNATTPSPNPAQNLSNWTVTPKEGAPAQGSAVPVGGDYFTLSRPLSINTKDKLTEYLINAGMDAQEDPTDLAEFYADKNNFGKPFKGFGARECIIELEPQRVERKNLKKDEGGEDWKDVARLDRDGHFFPRNAVKYINALDGGAKSSAKPAAKGQALNNARALFGKKPATGGHEGSETGETAPPAVGDADIPF